MIDQETEIMRAQLQQAIARILGLPRDGVAFIGVIAERTEDGGTSTLVLSMGLDSESVATVLAIASGRISGVEPVIKREFSAPGD